MSSAATVALPTGTKRIELRARVAVQEQPAAAARHRHVLAVRKAEHDAAAAPVDADDPVREAPGVRNAVHDHG